MCGMDAGGNLCPRNAPVGTCFFCWNMDVQDGQDDRVRLIVRIEDVCIFKTSFDMLVCSNILLEGDVYAQWPEILYLHPRLIHSVSLRLRKVQLLNA